MTFLELMQDHGLNSLIIAILVFILTAIVKMPLKKLAARSKDKSKYTRYITFLPLIISFGITILYEYILNGKVVFTEDILKLWLTSSSLSLAIYAFKEKFFPGSKKIMTEEEIAENEEAIEKMNEAISDRNLTVGEVESAITNVKTESTTDSSKEKIILRGRSEK